jgi:two-component system sensor histidine kinase KdpD
VKADLDVVHVVTGDATQPGGQRSVERLSELTADLGAHWHELHDDDPVQSIIAFAREHQITQIVIGSSRRSRWQQFTGGGSNVARIIREAGTFGIDVHVIARREVPDAGGAGAAAADAARR